MLCTRLWRKFTVTSLGLKVSLLVRYESLTAPFLDTAEARGLSTDTVCSALGAGALGTYTVAILSRYLYQCPLFYLVFFLKHGTVAPTMLLQTMLPPRLVLPPFLLPLPAILSAPSPEGLSTASRIHVTAHGHQVTATISTQHAGF